MLVVSLGDTRTLTKVKLLRRSGKTSYAAESAAIMPAMADSDELLEVKWKYFIKRESFKR